MTTGTVVEVLKKDPTSPQHERYLQWSTIPVFVCVIPRVVNWNYRYAWENFVREMEESKKLTKPQQRTLRDIGDLCQMLGIEPALFFYGTNEEIRENIFIYGRETEAAFEQKLSDDFFAALSSAITARVEHGRNIR